MHEVVEAEAVGHGADRLGDEDEALVLVLPVGEVAVGVQVVATCMYLDCRAGHFPYFLICSIIKQIVLHASYDAPSLCLIWCLSLVFGIMVSLKKKNI